MLENRLSVGAKLKEAGRHSIIYGLGSVAQSATAFLLLPILTGALSKDEYGIYSLILMACTVASAVFYLGMTSALPRSYFDYQSSEDRRAIFTTAFVILGCGALLQAALGYFGGGLISKLLVGDKRYDAVVAWAFFGSALGFINQYFFGFLRILRKSISSVVFSLVSLVGGVGFTLVLLNQTPENLLAPFQALTASQAVISVAFIALYGRIAFIARIEYRELYKLIPFGLASIAASFGSVVLDWADRLIIEHFLTLADVGTYSAAVRVGSLINVILILPFTQIWSPMMMEYREKSNIRDLFSRVLSYYLIIGGGVLVGSALFAAELLPLLIRSGVDSAVVIVFLNTMLGALIYGTTNIVSAGLFFERKVFQLPCVYYSVAAIKVLINILVIPLAGIIGATFGALAGYILMPLGIYALARRYFSFVIDWRRIVILSLNCLLPLIYGIFLSSHTDVGLFFRVVWFLITLGLIYLTCFSKSERFALHTMIRQALRF